LVALAKEAGLDEQLPRSYIKNSICHACYCLMSNSRIVEYLTELASDREFQERVAYGRVYYLKEARMFELLGLVDKATGQPRRDQARVRRVA
jgi:hypothetical protein